MNRYEVLKYSIEELRKKRRIDTPLRPGALIELKAYPKIIFEVLKLIEKRLIIWDKTFKTLDIPKTEDLTILTSGRYKEIERECQLQYMEESLYLDRRRASEHMYKLLSRLIPKVLSEDRFSLRINSDHLVELIIHYPEIIMKNSGGLSHKITDLYCRMLFESPKKLAQIGFARTSFSKEDLYVPGGVVRAFTHSHLNSSDIGRYNNNFCFGTSTNIGRIVNQYYKRIDFKTFTTFLINLEDTLKWESLEGGPYYRIHELFHKRERGSHGITFNMFGLSLAKKNSIYFQTLKTLKDLRKYPSFKLEKDSLYIPYKELLHQIITKAVVDNNVDNALYFYDSNTHSSYTSNNLKTEQYISMIEGAPSQVVFKGERIPIEFLGETDSSKEAEKLAHVDIYNYVVQRLEKDLERTLLALHFNNH